MTITAATPIENNLPVQATAFIGRSHELTSLDTYLANPQNRLVTIIGPGGMGKTRLALAWAERHIAASTSFPNGIFFISLAPLSEPAHIISATADALGLSLQGEEINQQSPVEQIGHHLRQKKVLLIMDNFEHLLHGASLLMTIFELAPQVQMIATSRERLHLPQEQVYPILGLDVPLSVSATDALAFTAVQLFQQSARRNDPHFTVNATHLPHLARICQLVQGTPLGIELAASWVDMMPLSEIADEIQHNLDFLETQNLGVTERHRSIRAVFEYSWQLLADEDRATLPRLSVFGGGFTRQAAQAVAGANLRQLSRLVNKSLLQYDKPRDRYHLHELLKQYAAEQLDLQGCTSDVSLAHARYYMHLLANQWDYCAGFSSLEQLKTITTDLDNIRQAWSYAVQQKASDLFANIGGTVMGFFGSSGLDLEGTVLTGQALAALQLPPTSDTAIQLRLAHAWLHVANDRPRAAELHLEVIALAEQRPPDQLLAIVYGYTALHFWLVGESEQTRQWGEKMYQVALTLAYEPARHYAQYLISSADVQLGVLDDDVRQKLEGVADYFQTHYPRALWLSWIYYGLGQWHRVHEAFDLACQYIEQGLVVVRYWGVLFPIGQGYFNLMQIYHQQGDEAQVRYYLQEYLTWYQARGHSWQVLDSIMEAVRAFPLVIGDLSLAVSLLSVVVHHPDTIPHCKMAAQTAVNELRPLLDPTCFTSAWLQGQTWDLQTAVTNLLSPLFQPQAPPPLVTAPQASPDTPVSRFWQEELLASGGHGEVYRGFDTLSDKQIVIKRLKKELVTNHPEMLARFLREADVLSHLNHPNIVKMIASQETDEGQMIVMEYVSGGSLDDLLKREKRLSIEQALNIALELADALARAHHLGIIHRDIKPANVLLATDGTPRLTDFGIASLKQAAQLTQTGVLLGTINYMSPEACESQPLDVRSDIWSFGSMLYEMLTGKPPFVGETLMYTVMAILTKPTPDLLAERPLTPPALVTLIEQMLVKDASRRLSSMRQIAADLEKIRAQLG